MLGLGLEVCSWLVFNFNLFFSLSHTLSLSLSHTHTHTHTIGISFSPSFSFGLSFFLSLSLSQSSFFSLLVLTAFFPLLLKTLWSSFLFFPTIFLEQQQLQQMAPENLVPAKIIDEMKFLVSRQMKRSSTFFAKKRVEMIKNWNRIFFLKIHFKLFIQIFRHWLV